jgi:DNA-binding MarR family transcriptional regulator
MIGHVLLSSGLLHWGQDREGDVQVSETAVALGELLDSADEVIDRPTAYLIGQLAAELIASASEADLGRLIVATEDSRQSSSSDREVARSPRQLLLSMLSGLLQGVLADRQSAGRTHSALTVRERMLNLLAIEPRNPTSLSTEIGCSTATASRALRRLREAGLVEDVTKPGLADGRHVMYQLTADGAKRQDDRFLGQLHDDAGVSEDEYEDHAYDYGESLATVTQLATELYQHDPAIAAELYPTLEVLKDQVDDPKLRAAALNELSVLSRSKRDLASAENSRSRLEKRIAPALQEFVLRAARAALQPMRDRKSKHRTLGA